MSDSVTQGLQDKQQLLMELNELISEWNCDAILAEERAADDVAASLRECAKQLSEALKPFLQVREYSEDINDDCDETIYGQINLGDPTDCETCGINQDRLTWNMAGPSTISVYLSVGCYHREDYIFDGVEDASKFFENELVTRFRDSRKALVSGAAEMRLKVSDYKN